MKRILCISACVAAFCPANAILTYMGTDCGENVTLAGIFNGGVFAGKLKFNDSLNACGVGFNFLTVCADLQHTIGTGNQWNPTCTLTGSMSANYALAGNIVDQYFNSAVLNPDCAGLQLAVWEAIYDGGVFDLNNGNVQATGSAGALAAAAFYYNNVSSTNSAMFIDDFNQVPGTFIGQGQLTPVPEPGSMVALACGAAIVILRRVKR